MNIVNKISLFCWGFVLSFIIFLIVMSVIPADLIWIVSAVTGLLILIPVGRNLWKQRKDFDFGWFLAVEKGYWRMMLGILGFSFLAAGFLGIIFPQVANDLAEKHWMRVAKVLVILFWTALTSTFLGWSLICFSEAAGFWRTGKVRAGFANFGIGFLWLLFSVLFLSLFLEVINDVFFALSSTVQNWVLMSFAVLTVLIGLLSGKYANLKGGKKSSVK